MLATTPTGVHSEHASPDHFAGQIGSVGSRSSFDSWPAGVYGGAEGTLDQRRGSGLSHRSRRSSAEGLGPGSGPGPSRRSSAETLEYGMPKYGSPGDANDVLTLPHRTTSLESIQTTGTSAPATPNRVVTTSFMDLQATASVFAETANALQANASSEEEGEDNDDDDDDDDDEYLQIAGANDSSDDADLDPDEYSGTETEDEGGAARGR